MTFFLSNHSVDNRYQFLLRGLVEIILCDEDLLMNGISKEFLFYISTMKKPSKRFNRRSMKQRRSTRENLF